MLPYAKHSKQKSVVKTMSFGGLDLSAAAPVGALVKTKNLSSLDDPYLCVRKDRRLFRAVNEGKSIGSYNGLYFVDGTDFYYNDKIRGTVEKGKKQMTVIGNRIVIFPDKLCYNITEDTMEPLEVRFSHDMTAEQGKLIFSENAITYETEDADFSFARMGFRVGDGITIDGFYTGEEEGITPQETWYAENNQTIVVRKVEDRVLTFSEKSFLPVTATAAVGHTITLCREVPNFTVVTEWNNRLWGAQGNTIYASKPGEPDNFFVYEGISTDAYTAVVGTPGAFTGCCVFGSCLLFFKEDGVHTIYGSRPQSFRVTYKPMPGVKAGCEASLCSLSEGLFYYGKDGPYLYNGASVTFLGRALGELRFSDVCAACDGRVLYVAMTDAKGVRGLYTRNTQNGMWLYEDATAVCGMCYHNGTVFLITEKAIYDVQGGDGTVAWEAVFHPLPEDATKKTRYFKLWLSLDIEKNSFVEASIAIDGAPFVSLGVLSDEGSHLLPLHIPPCHKLQLSLAGQGRCRIREIAREYLEF